MADVNAFAAIYFVLLVIIGSFILVNLILAVVLDDGDAGKPSDTMKDAALRQITHALVRNDFRCGFHRWR